MRALFDTGILRDYLRGDLRAKAEMGRYRLQEISVLSMLELMEAPEASHDPEALIAYLKSFRPVPIDTAVVQEAMVLRQTHKVAVPHALIWACARASGILFVTNAQSPYTKLDDPSIRIAY